MVACTLPQLIAACHVLHRLHAPRHPPCALSSLTIKFAQSELLLPEALTLQITHSLLALTFRIFFSRKVFYITYLVIKDLLILQKLQCLCNKPISTQVSATPLNLKYGGEGARTPDLRLAKPALCQTELHPQ